MKSFDRGRNGRKRPSDDEVCLATEDPVDQVEGEFDSPFSTPFDVGGVDTAVHRPGTEMTPAAGSLGLFR